MDHATHDYTRRRWGHDYTYTPKDNGLRARMMGWGGGLHRGDYLLLANPQAGRGYSRYQITKITYFRDPADMWSADVTYAPEGSAAVERAHAAYRGRRSPVDGL